MNKVAMLAVVVAAACGGSSGPCPGLMDRTDAQGISQYYLTCDCDGDNMETYGEQVICPLTGADMWHGCELLSCDERRDICVSGCYHH